MLTFQEVILKLQSYWGEQGCALLQPYDMEVGAGTSHTATFLRALGPEPWRAAYVQPSRRPKDGRYGENPNRMQHYYQYQVVLKPSPPNILELYLASLAALGFDLKKNDVRFVEDDWENPTLGAWGLGWEVWLNGMEVTQFTYFQQVGGLDCNPITGEITYGLERLCMYLQDKENVFDLVWTQWIEEGVQRTLTYRDVYHQNEVEQSTYNFEHSNVQKLFELFNHFEGEATRLLEAKLPLPGYEMILKAGHTFNLLDARGAISVTERAAYIGRIRNLSRLVATAYVEAREGLGFPMLPPGAAQGRRMKSATLLVELLAEELPPKALKKLGESFASGIADALRGRGFLGEAALAAAFATPRRISVSITEVGASITEPSRAVPLLPVNVAFDAKGAPTEALEKAIKAKAGFARFDLVPAERIERRNDGKMERVFYIEPPLAVSLRTALQEALDDAIAKLPIPKVMSYAAPGSYYNDVKFVRPAHRLVALHGADVLAVRALDLDAGRVTGGHRFLSRGDISITSADAYAPTLEAEGKVIPSFAARRARIVVGLEGAAADATPIMPDALLDEVTALVEWPVVYAGTFDASFLEVPQECLVLTMQLNQRYFALADDSGKLVNRFLLVSNIEAQDPSAIIAGNERVLRARLADAKFFFDQDRKQKLEARLPKLANVVYHNKLGSQADRSKRVGAVAAAIAGELGAARSLASRAAELAKADLVTDMVGEFPELQGLMGRYYAEHDGEPPDVSAAIEQHYWPRFAGDALPEGPVAQSVALADKLETLVGIWGIGLVPTGDKDPFGLRRHALGVLRILLERRLNLSLVGIIKRAADTFPPGTLGPDTADGVFGFMLDRLRQLLRDRGASPNEVEAVLADNPSRIDLVASRLAAVQEFAALPEATALSAANKRIVNILRKSGGEAAAAVDRGLLADGAEHDLFMAFQKLEPQVRADYDKQDFAGALRALATAKPAVDRYFDDVMVMVDDPAIRANRLALLRGVAATMNRVADISKLAQ